MTPTPEPMHLSGRVYHDPAELRLHLDDLGMRR
jgi:hypothetical protein